ncbi:Cu and Ag efflux protein CusF [Formivibrio citricus]|uniref:Cu and Ag efflux protein CusF n=1 Tax=Formivibrio citricus TaxID=83765 RepID=A0A1I4V4D2_9NEIS|nr:copper-binding protein [Formivibrio citricus]SFM96021.1 Cu and Ag efflux protein CusF [Formivibrio citricus]
MKHWLQATLLSAALAAPVYAAQPQSAEGTGVVQSVDAKAASVTLKHDPIPSLQWPAMTMPFKLAKPELAKGLATGQKVKFTLENSNTGYRITTISVVK